MLFVGYFVKQCVGSFVAMEFIRFKAKYLVFISTDVTDIICKTFAVLGYV